MSLGDNFIRLADRILDSDEGELAAVIPIHAARSYAFRWPPAVRVVHNNPDYYDGPEAA